MILENLLGIQSAIYILLRSTTTETSKKTAVKRTIFMRKYVMTLRIVTSSYCNCNIRIIKLFLVRSISIIIVTFNNYYLTKYNQVGRYSNTIGIPRETNLRFRNCPPLFPFEQWNTNDLTLADSNLTNNQTEGWNNRFSRLVGHKHLSIWVLITKMRLEYKLIQIKRS